MNIDWNVKEYLKDFAFVPKYGEAVLDMIDAAPGTLAVDLGCGNGGLTGKLIERGYRVIGVDASVSMLALAKERYPDTTFLQADACTFQLPEQADVIFSNAVLHWIDAAKQNELIANIASQLKPGGQLVCEFGGKGCAETVHAAMEKSCGSWADLPPHLLFPHGGGVRAHAGAPRLAGACGAAVRPPHAPTDGGRSGGLDTHV